MCEGDDACFLADDEDDGVTFLTESDGGAMAEAEVAVQVLPLADGEDARSAGDAVSTNDEASVVQRGFWMKDGDDEFGREDAVNFDAAFDVRLDVRPALDGDECAEAAVREVEGGLGKNFDGLALLELCPEEAVAADLRKQVTSKGGTTEAALMHLEAHGVRNLFTQAIAAAARRSAEMAEQLGKQ